VVEEMREVYVQIVEEEEEKKEKCKERSGHIGAEFAYPPYFFFIYDMRNERHAE
jgi:hypothetical protein